MGEFIQEDVDNFENLIKKVLPEYTGAIAGINGRSSNFAQKQMSEVLNDEPILIDGMSPIDAYFSAVEEKK